MVDCWPDNKLALVTGSGSTADIGLAIAIAKTLAAKVRK